MRAAMLLLCLAACGGGDGGADAGPIDGAAGADVLAVPDAPGPDAGPCTSCREILDGMGDPPFCPGSEALFTMLNDCTCVAGGPCFDECGANVCMGGMPDAACTACLQDTAAGCGDEYAACSQDT